jgi:TPR repeat protein
MHALSLRDKNIIPLLLDGYEMPESSILPKELQELPLHQALKVEVSEMEELYEKYFVEKEYLLSKPTNVARLSSIKNKGTFLATFLFYYDGFCYDVFEFGNLIVTIDENYDVNHPYKYGVNYAGEHKFSLLNNDTYESQNISLEIIPYYQKYTEIEWKVKERLKDLTEEIIKKENNPYFLTVWGEGLFMGTSTCDPNLNLSRACIDKALEKKSKRAEDFVKRNWTILCDRKVLWLYRRSWIELAAGLGDVTAQRYLGKAYAKEHKFDDSIKWYKEAIKNNDLEAMLDVIEACDHYSVYADIDFLQAVPSKIIAVNKAKTSFYKKKYLYNIIESSGDGDAILRLAEISKNQDEQKRLLLKSGELGCLSAYARLGYFFYKEDNYKDAIKYFQKTPDVDNSFDVAKCYYKLGDYLCAQQLCEQLLNEVNKEHDGGNVEVMFMLAQIYEKSDFFNEEKSNFYYKQFFKKYIKNKESKDYLYPSCAYDFYMGWILMHGKCCEPNYEKALYSYAHFYVNSYHYSDYRNDLLEQNIFEKDIFELINNVDLNTGRMLRCKGLLLFYYLSDIDKSVVFLEKAKLKGDPIAKEMIDCYSDPIYRLIHRYDPFGIKWREKWEDTI